MGRNVQKSEPKKTTAQMREERHRNSFATVETKGADDGAGSREIADAAFGIYQTATASTGDNKTLGDKALKRR